MTLLGKILIVFIFVMSIVYMGFALTIYATHTNWRMIVEQPGTGLKAQLAGLESENEQLKSDKEKLDSELAAERAAARQQLAKLETERVELLAQRRQMQDELNRLNDEKRTMTAALDSTQQNAARLTSEVEGLREEIRTSQQDRDTKFEQLVKLEDARNAAVGDLARLKEREAQLIGQIAEYTQKMKEAGIDPNRPLVGEPPMIDGLITAVRENNLIEVSIGSDDGLRVGHTLEVFRPGKSYLGKAEIVRTAPDRSVGKLLPQFTQGTIQKGDHVATRLKVS